jgi:hypothetical protein
MMRCTKMFSLVALTSAFAGGLAFVSLTNTATAEDAMPDLCVAVGATIDLELAIGGCLYSSTDAPLLNLDVCWDGNTARIKPSLGCPAKQATYNVKYGEVINPLSNEVIGYAPLPDACELVPCEPSDYNSQALVDGVACCDPNTGECTAPDANGNCIGGEITWCKEIEVNSEGNLICHE